jgi:hypothetical protein
MMPKLHLDERPERGFGEHAARSYFPASQHRIGGTFSSSVVTLGE